MSRKKEVGSNRLLLAIPVAVFLLSIGFLASNFVQTGNWVDRSIELRGGTLISLSTDSQHDLQEIEQELSEDFGSVIVRELRSYSGFGLTIQLEPGTDSEAVVEKLSGLGVDTSEVSIETVGPALGESFWIQAQISIAVAFILMGIIVFAIFRTLVPSAAVILAALFNTIIVLGGMQVTGIELSLASFAALLMLIGYSIDTDILLTTRILRTSEGSVAERVWGAFRTGMTMTVTTMSVLAAVILTTTSAVLFAIAAVLLLGMLSDIMNTWLMNAVIIRHYAEKRGL